jgi:hypothetical protein
MDIGFHSQRTPRSIIAATKDGKDGKEVELNLPKGGSSRSF